MNIVILHRGWVVVGEMSVKNNWVRLENAYVVRRWGTSKGLGELAAEGPTPNTVLDPSPAMNIPESAIINTIECNKKSWKKWIK